MPTEIRISQFDSIADAAVLPNFYILAVRRDINGNIVGNNKLTLQQAISACALSLDNILLSGGVVDDLVPTTEDGVLVLKPIPSSTAGNPAGSSGQIQFNGDGEFSASSNLTFNTSTNILATGNGFQFINAGSGSNIFRPTDKPIASRNGLELRSNYDPNGSFSSIHVIARDGSLAESNEIILETSADTGNIVARFRIDSNEFAPIWSTNLGTAGGVEHYILHEGNVKTINGESIYGAGDITLTSAPAGADEQFQFNDLGTLSGTPGYTWNTAANRPESVNGYFFGQNTILEELLTTLTEQTSYMRLEPVAGYSSSVELVNDIGTTNTVRLRTFAITDERYFQIEFDQDAPRYFDGTTLNKVLHEGNVKTVGGQDVIGTGNIEPIQSFIVPITGHGDAVLLGTDLASIRMPYAFTLTEVRASLVAPQTSGSILTCNIYANGVNILSIPLTFNNGDKTTVTATTPAVLSVTSLADDAEITFDVTQVGDGTAEGLKVTLIGRKS